MAITGKFQGDFASFSTAVDQATAKLRSFESGAANVEARLNKMADAFSGRKVISDATLMAKAVEEIGGVAKLTASELEHVTRTATEAVDKMKRLGIEVPPGLQSIADHSKKIAAAFAEMDAARPFVKAEDGAKKTNTELAKIPGTLKDIAAALGLAFSVDRVVAFVSSVAQGAKELRNLSLETGIGTTQLQLYGAVTEDLGVKSDELGKAIYQLSTRIAGGDASAAGALHSLGLTLEELKGKSPDELFRTLVRAIDTVPDHLTKVNTAADLFGTRAGGAIVKVAHNFDEAVANARTLNRVMNEETVQAAAKAAENYDRLATNVKNVGAAFLGPFFEGFNQIVETVDKGNSKWDTFLTTIGAITGVFTNAEGKATTLKEALDRLGKSLPKGDINLPAEKPVKAKAAPSPEDIMTAIRADDLKPLTEIQEKYLEQLFDIGKLTTENAAAFQVSGEQLDAFRKKEEQQIQTQATLSDQLRAMKELQTTVFSKGIELTDKLNEGAAKTLELRNQYLQSLRDEVREAQKVNEQRNLGAAPRDVGREAAERRDRELASISAKQAAAPGLDLGPLIQKTWQDFDAMLGILKGDRAAGVSPLAAAAAPPPVTVNVSGVWDPATISQLTDAISTELLKRSNRKLPAS